MTIHRALIWLEQTRELNNAEKRKYLGPHYDPYQIALGTFRSSDIRLLAASDSRKLLLRLSRVSPTLDLDLQSAPTIQLL